VTDQQAELLAFCVCKVCHRVTHCGRSTWSDTSRPYGTGSSLFRGSGVRCAEAGGRVCRKATARL